MRMKQMQRKVKLREGERESTNDIFKPLESSMPEARMPLAFPFL